jgi:dTDP-4-amino-4,6-dideoxygalactose transaminase
MATRQSRALRREYLPFSPPAIGAEEIAEVVDTLHSPWITTGPKVQRFERAFAEYFGVPEAVAMSSCTAALHTALVAMGVGPGDEVVTSPITFAATVNVIEHVGARPVLADVDPETLNLDPARVEAAITPRTRVLLPVHFAGHPAELDAIRAIAEAHRLLVLEDAAHALPAAYKGEPIGSGPHPAAFSFYATKNLTTAEGGMLTGPAEVLRQARVIGQHGMTKDAWKRYARGGSWRYEVVLPGFKYNMTDIAAAMGIHQLAKLDAFHRRREDIAAQYSEAFAEEPALEVPVRRTHVEHAWHLYVLRLHPEALRIDRDQFIEELALREIGTSVHFIPIHLHPYYRDKYGYVPERFPVAHGNFERMLSLPLHPRLSDDDVADVIDAVLDVAQTNRR